MSKNKGKVIKLICKKEEGKDSVEKIKLKNRNPTKAEKEMFRRYALYPVEDTDIFTIDKKGAQKYIRYAVCHTAKARKDYPAKIRIAENRIDYKQSVTFCSSSEWIQITGFVDLYLLELIKERAKELGFKEIQPQIEIRCGRE